MKGCRRGLPPHTDFAHPFNCDIKTGFIGQRMAAVWNSSLGNCKYYLASSLWCFTTVWFLMIQSQFSVYSCSTVSCLSGRPTMRCSWFAACSRCSSGRWARKSCTSSSPTRRGHQAPAEVSAPVEFIGNGRVPLHTLIPTSPEGPVHQCFVLVFF